MAPVFLAASACVLAGLGQTVPCIVVKLCDECWCQIADGLVRALVLNQWAHWFNEQLHSAVNYLTPNGYEQQYYRANSPRASVFGSPRSSTLITRSGRLATSAHPATTLP